MIGSGTPDWLEDNGESAKKSGSGLDPFADESTTASEINNGNDNNDKTNKESSSRSRFACSFGAILLTLISLALLGLFAYAAYTQNNDIDGIQWIIFYSCNAAVPAIFLVYYVCCFPAKAMYLLSAATAIWSIVYIVLAALKVKDEPAGGDTNGTGDNDGQTLREEYIYELAGASIALFSSLYHACMTKCCAKKGDDEQAK